MSQSRFSRQAGVFSMLTAGTLMLALSCLVLVLDSGRLYMEQRKLQKLADTAALETVARFKDPLCIKNDINALAQDNAALNGFSGVMQEMGAKCVRVVDTGDGLNTPIIDDSGNAVQTTATETVPASLIWRTGKLFKLDFPSTVNLQAQAVAERSSEPTAVFSIGAQLLRLNKDEQLENNKLLVSLLATVGLNPEVITVLDSNGLANASITSAGLLRALGVKLSVPELKILSPEELVELVNTEVGLVGIEKLITDSATLVGTDTAGTDAKLLSSALLSEQLTNIEFDLLATATSPGLISLTGRRNEDDKNNGDIGAALDARITLGEILKTAILTGVSGRAIHVPELNILGPAVSVELGIVEPPSLAVGPVETTAYNAQVRLYADIDSDKLPIIGFLTKILGVRVHLPLAVDLVTAQAELTSVQCHANPPTASFKVDSTLLNVCIGKIADDVKWSGSARCEDNLQETQLVKLQPELLSLLKIKAVDLTGKVHIPGLSQKDNLNELTIGEHLTPTNDIALGTSVNDITVALLDLLAGLLRAPQITPNNYLTYSGMDDKSKIRFLANSYLEKTKNNTGKYNIDAVTKLILNGDKGSTSNDEFSFPPLVTSDWIIERSIPRSCVIGACPSSSWVDGKFSEAFKSYTSVPYGVLDVAGIPTLGKGFQSCAGLLSALLNWNKCVEHNLTKLLQDNANKLDLFHLNDGNGLLEPKSEAFSCNGLVCLLIKPLLTTLKPILNDVGSQILHPTLDMLGLELGQSTLAVHDINCGAPRLVGMGSKKQ